MQRIDVQNAPTPEDEKVQNLPQEAEIHILERNYNTELTLDAFKHNIDLYKLKFAVIKKELLGNKTFSTSKHTILLSQFSDAINRLDAIKQFDDIDQFFKKNKHGHFEIAKMAIGKAEQVATSKPYEDALLTVCLLNSAILTQLYPVDSTTKSITKKPFMHEQKNVIQSSLAGFSNWMKQFDKNGLSERRNALYEIISASEPSSAEPTSKSEGPELSITVTSEPSQSSPEPSSFATPLPSPRTPVSQKLTPPPLLSTTTPETQARIAILESRLLSEVKKPTPKAQDTSRDDETLLDQFPPQMKQLVQSRVDREKRQLKTQLETQHAESSAKLTEQNKGLEQKITELAAKKIELSSEVAKLKSEALHSSEKHAQELKSLETKAAANAKQLHSLEAELASTLASAKESQTANDRLSRLSAQQSRTIDSLQTQLTQIQREHEALSQSFNITVEANRESNAELASVKQTLAATQQRLDTANQKNAKLTLENQSLPSPWKYVLLGMGIGIAAIATATGIGALVGLPILATVVPTLIAQILAYGVGGSLVGGFLGYKAFQQCRPHVESDTTYDQSPTITPASEKIVSDSEASDTVRIYQQRQIQPKKVSVAEEGMFGSSRATAAAQPPVELTQGQSLRI